MRVSNYRGRDCEVMQGSISTDVDKRLLGANTSWNRVRFTRGFGTKAATWAIGLALAASSGDRKDTIDATADLLYHMIVLVADQGIGLAEVARHLESRHSSRNLSD